MACDKTGSIKVAFLRKFAHFGWLQTTNLEIISEGLYDTIAGVNLYTNAD
jgi:hypothetical protein